MIKKLIDDKIEFWNNQVKELVKKLPKEAVEGREIKIGKIKEKDLREGIVNRLIIIDELEYVRNKLEGG